MRKCEVCGSSKYKKIYHDVVVCTNCGFAYNNNCSQKERDDYYEKMEQKSQYLKNMLYPPLYFKSKESTVKFINKFRKGKILDIGCYTGEVVRQLGNAEGIDPSLKSVEYARCQGLKVLKGNILTYKFKKKYGTLLLIHVLEHIVDLKKLSLILSELLEERGRIIIETPDATRFNLERGDNYYADQTEPFLQFSYEHVNYFTPLSISRLFVNFKVISSQQLTVGLHIIRIVLEKQTENTIPSLNKHVVQSKRELKRIDKKLSKINFPIYVWGLGKYTKKLLEHTRLRSLKIDSFIDLYNLKKTHIGIPVIQKPVKNIPIIVGSMTFKQSILDEIKKYGNKPIIL